MLPLQRSMAKGSPGAGFRMEYDKRLLFPVSKSRANTRIAGTVALTGKFWNTSAVKLMVPNCGGKLTSSTLITTRATVLVC